MSSTSMERAIEAHSCDEPGMEKAATVTVIASQGEFEGVLLELKIPDLKEYLMVELNGDDAHKLKGALEDALNILWADAN